MNAIESYVWVNWNRKSQRKMKESKNSYRFNAIFFPLSILFMHTHLLSERIQCARTNGTIDKMDFAETYYLKRKGKKLKNQKKNFFCVWRMKFQFIVRFHRRRSIETTWMKMNVKPNHIIILLQLLFLSVWLWAIRDFKANGIK